MLQYFCNFFRAHHFDRTHPHIQTSWQPPSLSLGYTWVEGVMCQRHNHTLCSDCQPLAGKRGLDLCQRISGQRKAFSFGLSECLTEGGGKQRVRTDPRHVYMYRFVSKTALNRKNFMQRFPRVVSVSVEYFWNLSNYYCFIYPFTIEEK